MDGPTSSSSLVFGDTPVPDEHPAILATGYSQLAIPAFVDSSEEVAAPRLHAGGVLKREAPALGGTGEGADDALHHLLQTHTDRRTKGRGGGEEPMDKFCGSGRASIEHAPNVDGGVKQGEASYTTELLWEERRATKHAFC